MQLQKANNELQTTNSRIGLVASPIDRRAMENLLPAEKRIIEAALQPKINMLPAVDAVLSINTIISATYTRAGFKMPDEDTLATYADEFYKALMERHPGTTVAEVRESLKAGVYGDAGEFTGLNPKTFMQFVKHYRSTDIRKDAFRVFESKRYFLNNQLNISPGEKDEANKRLVNTLYADYKLEQLKADLIPVFIYDFLTDAGLITLSKVEKKAIQERAIKYYSGRKVNNRYRGNTKSIGDELADYIASQGKDDGVIMVSKQFAVSDFFGECIKAGMKEIFKTINLLQ